MGELMKKLATGKLSLRDMRTQFVSVLKLGPMNSILSYIPAFGNMGKEMGDESQKQIQKCLVLMDSMTDEELDATDVKLLRKQSRRKRIMQGSGLRDGDVMLDYLLKMYKSFEGAAQK